jgi:hypothetical protein
MTSAVSRVACMRLLDAVADFFQASYPLIATEPSSLNIRIFPGIFICTKPATNDAFPYLTVRGNPIFMYFKKRYLLGVGFVIVKGISHVESVVPV